MQQVGRRFVLQLGQVRPDLVADRRRADGRRNRSWRTRPGRGRRRRGASARPDSVEDLLPIRVDRGGEELGGPLPDRRRLCPRATAGGGRHRFGRPGSCCARSRREGLARHRGWLRSRSRICDFSVGEYPPQPASRADGMSSPGIRDERDRRGGLNRGRLLRREQSGEHLAVGGITAEQGKRRPVDLRRLACGSAAIRAPASITRPIAARRVIGESASGSVTVVQRLEQRREHRHCDPTIRSDRATPAGRDNASRLPRAAAVVHQGLRNRGRYAVRALHWPRAARTACDIRRADTAHHGRRQIGVIRMIQSELRQLVRPPRHPSIRRD